MGARAGAARAELNPSFPGLALQNSVFGLSSGEQMPVPRRLAAQLNLQPAGWGSGWARGRGGC